MKKVLLAIGNESYSNIIRNRLSEHKEHFLIPEQKVMHHRYLKEVVELEKTDLLILHDYYLPSDFDSKEGVWEWLSYIQHIRELYDDSIRVVFLCERNRGDPFSYLNW
ncbi:hypothetical protein [Sediminibacillus halophilus]|uniref:Uncharacterized protein n=1 Tax=Sediminibacillus halophilus TaxID=482461 RepID=A0A1G9RMK4_9BACI|nr:hypothetical protein [Sediminibacillus halophilus]SDM24486.1 hypothetical protein SAMN05216244_2054 [Sediminibacillus halophilus]